MKRIMSKHLKFALVTVCLLSVTMTVNSKSKTYEDLENMK